MRMRLVGGERTEPRWLYGLAGALMLGGPVARELYVHHYPARPEAFLLPVIAATLGAIITIGGWHIGGLLGTVVFGGLLFVFTDIQFDPHRLTYTAAVLAACIALAQLFVRHRATLFALTAGTFYVTSVARPAVAPQPSRMDTSGTSQSANPLLVHVVLDGQWGVGGLRAAGDTATARFLEGFYAERGFQLYASAYSRYRETVESFRGLMFLGDTATERPPSRPPFDISLRRNPYFNRLRELGYTIRVRQSTYIDFCNSDVLVASCDVQAGNSIANIGFLGGSWRNRGVLTTQYFLSTRSHVFRRLIPGEGSWRRAAAGGSIAALQNLSGAIRAAPPGGTAWIVHLMTPHRPNQADEECAIQTDPARYLDYSLPAYPSDSLWRAALHMYADQVRCAHGLLADVLEALDEVVGRERSIVIVQGDHGSRMHQRELHDPEQPLGSYSDVELNSHFSTLFAIRRPNFPAALKSEPVPVQDVIAALARSGFTSALPDTWSHHVRKWPDHPGQSEEVRFLEITEMPWLRQPD